MEASLNHHPDQSVSKLLPPSLYPSIEEEVSARARSEDGAARVDASRMRSAVSDTLGEAKDRVWRDRER